MKSTRLRQILIAISIITLITAATSCSLSSTTDIQDSTQDAEDLANPVTLTLLAYDSFTPTPNIFDDFTAQTGIKVSIALGGDAGELVTKAALTQETQRQTFYGVSTTHSSRARSPQKSLRHTNQKILPTSTQLHANSCPTLK